MSEVIIKGHSRSWRVGDVYFLDRTMSPSKVIALPESLKQALDDNDWPRGGIVVIDGATLLVNDVQACFLGRPFQVLAEARAGVVT